MGLIKALKSQIILSLLVLIGTTSVVAKPIFTSDQDQQIYDETFLQCSKVQPGSWSKVKSIYFNQTQRHAFKEALVQAGLAGFFDERALGNYYLNKGISKYTYDLLNSDGFISALFDCFPNSENDRNHFVISLLAFEWAGKSTAVIAHYLTTYKLLAFGMGKVSSYLALKVPRMGVALSWTLRGIAVYSAVNMLRKIYANPSAEQVRQYDDIVNKIEEKPQESLQETLNLLDLGIRKIDQNLASQILTESERQSLNSKKEILINHKNSLQKYKNNVGHV